MPKGWIKTLKEQYLWARTYRDVDDLRQTVAAFVELYNTQWPTNASATKHHTRPTNTGLPTKRQPPNSQPTYPRDRVRLTSSLPMWRAAGGRAVRKDYDGSLQSRPVDRKLAPEGAG